MRVLLIEDDHATAQSIELMLKSEGFNVYTTDLGEEGLDDALVLFSQHGARAVHQRRARLHLPGDVFDDAQLGHGEFVDLLLAELPLLVGLAAEGAGARDQDRADSPPAAEAGERIVKLDAFRKK
jgi:CheY-like chemotaxis protein